MADSTYVQFFQGVTIQEENIILQSKFDSIFQAIKDPTGLNDKVDCVFGFRHYINNNVSMDNINFNDVLQFSTRKLKKSSSNIPMKASCDILSTPDSIFEYAGYDDNADNITLSLMGLSRDTDETIPNFLKRLGLLSSCYFDNVLYNKYFNDHYRVMQNFITGKNSSVIPINKNIPLDSYLYIIYYMRISFFGWWSGGGTWKQDIFFEPAYSCSLTKEVEIEI
jgi:hypothetical protein